MRDVNALLLLSAQCAALEDGTHIGSFIINVCLCVCTESESPIH